MLLAIDIGNTDTVVGLFDDGRLIDFFRVASNHSLTVDECGFFVTGLLEKLNVHTVKISRVVIASVVPRLTPVYNQMSQKYLSATAYNVTADIKMPIKIGYEDPSEVGADRIANTVAAYQKYGCPVIIVDFGTATTFDVIDKAGVYLGGVIAPGIKTAGAELARRAARLFEVNIEKPKSVIGRTTADSLKSGLFYGGVGQVDYLLKHIIAELGGGEIKVISTGGLSAEISHNSEYISSVEPTLTLDGLKIIADLNI
jgi:type III pantothenate kinase